MRRAPAACLIPAPPTSTTTLPPRHQPCRLTLGPLLIIIPCPHLARSVDQLGLPGPARVFVFNGDYVDRGSWGVELVALLVRAGRRGREGARKGRKERKEGKEGKEGTGGKEGTEGEELKEGREGRGRGERYGGPGGGAGLQWAG